MKRHCYTFVNYKQDEWFEKQVMAKFVEFNSKSTSIKLSASFVKKIFYPCIRYNMIDLSNTSICERMIKEKALNISKNMKIT